MRFSSRLSSGLAALALLALMGCCCTPHAQPSTQPAAVGLLPPSYDADVLAICDPPIDWHADPLKNSSGHAHQVWVSPTGATAYGVIHFNLFLPVGQDLALTGFMRQMKATEGDADLISKQNDPAIDGLRFVADGGQYRIRVNLMVRGWEGWAVYAGTLRKSPVNPKELDLAENARENTRVGKLAPPSKQATTRRK